MAQQQTLKQAFAAAQRKKTASTKPLRQTTLNFDGCAPPIDNRDFDCYSDGSCPCEEHADMMNDEFICICKRECERCDYDADPDSCKCNACWEARVEDDASLRLSSSCRLEEEEESSYTDELWQKMTPHGGKYIYHCYYDHRKPQDLKKFVQQRGLKDAYPNGITLKYYYIKKLLPSDRESVFRFLDLPAEMRNQIYGHLLFIPGKGVYRRKCFPQILRTCRQVREEATEILYTDNVISAEIMRKPGQSSLPVQQWVAVRTRPGNFPNHTPQFAQLPNAIDHYPPFLARIRSLEIVITIEWSPHGSSHERNAAADFVRSSLLALASVLMDGGHLRNLHVVIHEKFQLSTETLASILYPLRRLRHVDATFNSDRLMPEILRDDMIAEMRPREPAFNTLKQCQLVLAEADVYLKMARLLHPPHGETWSNQPVDSRSSIVEAQVRELRAKMIRQRSLFADWLGDVKVQTRLAKLQDQLARVMPDEIMRLAKEFTEAHGETSAYQKKEHQRWSISDLSRAKSPSPDPAPL